MEYNNTERRFTEWLANQPIQVEKDIFQQNVGNFLALMKEASPDHASYTETLQGFIDGKYLMWPIPLRDFISEPFEEALHACVSLIIDPFHSPSGKKLLMRKLRKELNKAFTALAFAFVRKDHADTETELDRMRLGHLSRGVLSNISENIWAVSVGEEAELVFRDEFLGLGFEVGGSDENPGSGDCLALENKVPRENIPSEWAKLWAMAVNIAELDFICAYVLEEPEQSIIEPLMKSEEANRAWNDIVRSPNTSQYELTKFLQAVIGAFESTWCRFAMLFGLRLGELTSMMVGFASPYIGLDAHKYISAIYRSVGNAARRGTLNKKILEYAEEKLKNGTYTSAYALAKAVYKDLERAKEQIDKAMADNGNKISKDGTNLENNLLIKLGLIDYVGNKFPPTCKTLTNLFKKHLKF